MGWTGCFPSRVALLAGNGKQENDGSATHSHRRRHWQGRVSLRWVWCRRKGRLPEEDQAPGAQGCLREAAAVHCRHGSLPERAFCQPGATRTGARAADHPGDLREAVHEGAEERLQRWRGNRRSRVAPEPAVCSGEEPGSARPAGLSSRPVAIGVSPNGDGQPDTRFSDRAGYRRQARLAHPPQLAFRDPGEPQGRDFATND
jgi:hypothetical protein